MKDMSINEIINLQIQNENEGITPSLPLERPSQNDRATIPPDKFYWLKIDACKRNSD